MTLPLAILLALSNPRAGALLSHPVKHAPTFALFKPLPKVVIPCQDCVQADWDAVPGVAGYNLYSGPASRVYTNRVQSSITSATIANAPYGARLFCAVTAYDAAGMESDFSAEASIVVGLHGVVITEQASDNMAAWADQISFTNSWWSTNPSPPASKFWRLKIKSVQ
jgi:hypothetical protein